jgi:Flavin reductase like domain
LSQSSREDAFASAIASRTSHWPPGLSRTPAGGNRIDGTTQWRSHGTAAGTWRRGNALKAYRPSEAGARLASGVRRRRGPRREAVGAATASELPCGESWFGQAKNSLYAAARGRLPPTAVMVGRGMHFDLAAIPATDAYKLIVSTVVPRPIALVTTVDDAGRANPAPFSFFNAVSSVPSVVVLGISPGGPNNDLGDGYKDTERNIRDTGEFVVNLVDEALAERMNRAPSTKSGGSLERMSFAEWKDSKR